MKVVHVLPSLATGGAENLVVNLADAMRQAGTDVQIVTFADVPGVPRERASQIQLPVVTLGNSPRDPRTIFRLRATVLGADVVHVHLFPALYYVAAAKLSQPLIYTEHSTHNRRRTNRLFRPLEKRAYRRYRGAIGISSGVSESLDTYLRSLGLQPRVETIYNGIGREFYEFPATVLPRNENALRLIAIGTLDSRKNLSEAVSAVASLEDVELTIVGDGPERESIQSQIADAGADSRIRMLGRRSDIVALLDEHHALLSTSRYEGFGLVAAEAMARGCPVVGPDVTGFSEVVLHDETGLLYSRQGNAAENAALAIKRLRDSKSLYESLAQRAIEVSVKFAIGSSALAHLNLYARLTS